MEQVVGAISHMVIQDMSHRLFDIGLPFDTFDYNEDNINNYITNFLNQNPGLVPLLENDLVQLHEDDDGDFYEDCLYHMIHHGIEDRIKTEILYGDNQFVKVTNPDIQLKDVLK